MLFVVEGNVKIRNRVSAELLRSIMVRVALTPIILQDLVISGSAAVRLIGPAVVHVMVNGPVAVLELILVIATRNEPGPSSLSLLTVKVVCPTVAVKDRVSKQSRK